MKIVVSIATIPSRIGKMRPTIQSLLGGNIVPDEILIIHPEYCQLESSGYETPDFLKDPSFGLGRVKEVIAEQDWGPSTKYLGALDHLSEPCFLVIADDDVYYKPHFIETLMASQQQDLRASFAFHTYRMRGITIALGCDGISFWSENLTGMRAFADTYVTGTDLRLHDDLWVGFFLAQKGVPLKSLEHQLRGEIVYEQLLENNVLSSLTGRLSREEISRVHLRRLFKEYNLSGLQRTKFFATFVRDAVARVLWRAKRKFNKTFRSRPA